MNTQPARIHLFHAYGIEIEYMIVDSQTLAVKPIADELLHAVLGSYESDFDNGTVTWSNELVLHVIEMKSSRPEQNLRELALVFAENVKQINTLLAAHNAMLLPTGIHPFMDPLKEARLWPHENNEVYEIYNKIFDCRGHGWSNVQSTHLNLPFYDDEEFARLHAAIRLVLPILPALCASSPVLGGRFSGAYDTRLKYYKINQSKIPSITGWVVPEAVFSKRNYLNTIYDRIKTDIAPYNEQQILNPIWVNSRGAIARFDRGSIEIRIMDCQECPAADMAIVTFVVELIKALANHKFVDLEVQMKWKAEPLARILDQVVEGAQGAIIDAADYLKIFGVTQSVMSAGDLWKFLLNKLMELPESPLGLWKHELHVILQYGTLAQRIIHALDNNYEHDNIVKLYRALGNCLHENQMFTP